MSYADDYARRTGARLRILRRQRGLSLLQVEQASCGQFRAATVGDWERGSQRGQRGQPVERLAEYARWLGVSMRLILPPGPGQEDPLLLVAARINAAAALSELIESCRILAASPQDFAHLAGPLSVLLDDVSAPLREAAATIARNAVHEVTNAFWSVSPEKARELVTQALEDFGGTAA